MSGEVVVPEGWRAATLGSLGVYRNGRAFKKSEWSRSGRPIIRIQDLTKSNDDPNYFSGEVEARYVVQPGDLLISWAATLGAYVWRGPEAVLNQHIFKVESKINKRFHYQLVRALLAELQRNTHGSGMVHITKDVFDAMPVALPPDEAAQATIADFLETAENSKAAASEHLATAHLALTRLRASILAAACSGQLTAKWRESSGTSVEPELVEAARGRRKKTLGKRFREPEPNRHRSHAETPDGWALVPLGLVLERLDYGTSQRSSYGVDGAAVIRIPNVSSGRLSLEDLKFAVLDLREQGELSLAENDLLMVRSNGSVDVLGTTALVTSNAVGMAFAGYLLRLRVDKSIMLPEFLTLALASPLLRTQIELPARSTSGVHNINTDEVRGLLVPLPPIEEQRRIATGVVSMFGALDASLLRIDKARRQVDRSFEAVLAKAFRGQLGAS